MFLPPRDIIPKTAYTDPELLAGAFNHPVVVIANPADPQHTSRVEFAIVSKKNADMIAQPN
jgi:hypothetical protein